MIRRSLALLLFAAALVAGCGTPGGDSSDNTKKADEAKKNSAKVDVAKAGDVTLTIWDQEVRGGQKKQITRLNEAMVKVLTTDAVKEKLATLGLAVAPSTPAELAAVVREGLAVRGELVKAANIQAE